MRSRRRAHAGRSLRRRSRAVTPECEEGEWDSEVVGEGSGRFAPVRVVTIHTEFIRCLGCMCKNINSVSERVLVTATESACVRPSEVGVSVSRPC